MGIGRRRRSGIYSHNFRCRAQKRGPFLDRSSVARPIYRLSGPLLLLVPHAAIHANVGKQNIYDEIATEFRNERENIKRTQTGTPRTTHGERRAQYRQITRHELCTQSILANT